MDATRKTYVRDTNGKLWGRPGTGVESKYLLTGFAQCACCHRNVTKIGRVGSPGKGRVTHYYGCSYHATRGRTICSNDLLAPMEAADAIVIEQVRSALTPDVPLARQALRELIPGRIEFQPMEQAGKQGYLHPGPAGWKYRIGVPTGIDGLHKLSVDPLGSKNLGAALFYPDALGGTRMDTFVKVIEIVGMVFLIAVILKVKAWMRTGFWEWLERVRARKEARRVEKLVIEQRQSERELEDFYKGQASSEPGSKVSNP